MKWRNNIFLFAMLVIIPFVSWFFLTGGVDYRLESLDQLKMEKPVDESVFHSKEVVLKDHVTFVAREGDEQLLSQLFDQFKNAPGFQMVSSNTINGIEKEKNFIVLDSIDFELIDDKESKYYLIDGNKNLRKSYLNNSESKDMVRHIATILPFVEKKNNKDVY